MVAGRLDPPGRLADRRRPRRGRGRRPGDRRRGRGGPGRHPRREVARPRSRCAPSCPGSRSRGPEAQVARRRAAAEHDLRKAGKITGDLVFTVDDDATEITVAARAGRARRQGSAASPWRLVPGLLAGHHDRGRGVAAVTVVVTAAPRRCSTPGRGLRRLGAGSADDCRQRDRRRPGRDAGLARRPRHGRVLAPAVAHRQRAGRPVHRRRCGVQPWSDWPAVVTPAVVGLASRRRRLPAGRCDGAAVVRLQPSHDRRALLDCQPLATSQPVSDFQPLSDFRAGRSAEPACHRRLGEPVDGTSSAARLVGRPASTCGPPACGDVVGARPRSIGRRCVGHAGRTVAVAATLVAGGPAAAAAALAVLGWHAASRRRARATSTGVVGAGRTAGAGGRRAVDRRGRTSDGRST